MKVSPILIALIIGAALALPVALMPVARLEALLVASGLPGLIPAFRPPLGGTTRNLLAVALGVAPLLVAVLAVIATRHLEEAAEAQAVADFEAAGAGRRLFRPAPLPSKRDLDAAEPSSPVPTTAEATLEPEPLDLTGSVLAAPEELGSPPPEPMPAPPPPPLVEPESLRKPRPRPATAPPPPLPAAPPETGGQTRLDQLEAMLGALPPLPHRAGASPPPATRRKTKAKGAATARDVKSGVVRGSDPATESEEVFTRLERALAELRRLER